MALWGAIVVCLGTASAGADDNGEPGPAAQLANRNLAIFLTLNESITDTVTASVRRAALNCRRRPCRSRSRRSSFWN